MRALARRHANSAFTVLVIVFLAAAIYTARDFTSQARFFPWAIGIPALILAVSQLAIEVSRVYRHGADRDADDAGIVDLAVDRDVPIQVVVRRGGALALWILGYFAGILLFGFIIASPVFVFLYLAFRAHASPRVVLLNVLLIIVLQIAVFDRVLHLPWLRGAIPGPQQFILDLLS